MKTRKDIYVVGYTGHGNSVGEGQPVWGQPQIDEEGKRIVGGGQAIHPLTLNKAREEIKELITRAPKAIYKLVIVEKYKT